MVQQDGRGMFKGAKVCVCVFVFRCHRCNSVHHLFACSLRRPLEVHGVATQTVNNGRHLFFTSLGWILSILPAGTFSFFSCLLADEMKIARWIIAVLRVRRSDRNCFSFRKKRKTRVRGHQQASVWRLAPAMVQTPTWADVAPGHRPHCWATDKDPSNGSDGGATAHRFAWFIYFPRLARRTQMSTSMWKRVNGGQ